MKKTLFLAISVLILFPSFSSAYWEWTPQARRWINPKYAAKETPEAQFAWAEEYVIKRDYSTAIRKLEQLIQVFPNSPLAARTQYRMGELYQMAGDWEKAFKAYQKVVNNYPGSEFVTSAISRQFSIGEAQTAKESGRFSFLRTDHSEILGEVVDSAPYAPEAEKALYDLGHHQVRRGNFSESIKTFERLVKNYPDSLFAEKAELETAQAEVELYRRQENSDDLLFSASNRLATFLMKYPQGKYRVPAERLYRQTREMLAEKVFEIARFYQKGENPKAAKIYYQKIFAEYPETSVAKKAKSLLPKQN
ncbi:MAG: tetratricopeptide repeat protein [Candidatus Omnitrophota bacterium]